MLFRRCLPPDLYRDRSSDRLYRTADHQSGGRRKAIVAIMKNFFYYPNAAAAAKYFGTTLIKASALLMCALSVLFAYKAGLFNIGAAGQYVVGAGGCLYMALKFEMPWYVCLLAGVIVAAIVGGISGALKAYLNVNEVISCIMLNWISVRREHAADNGKRYFHTVYQTAV